MKIIFHIDETKKWDLTLRNVRNFLNSYDGKAEVIVLANGDGVKGYLKDSVLEDFLEELEDRDVIFEVCGKSLFVNGIEKEYIFDFVEVVESGVVELALRQQDGYGYIKP